MKDPLERKHGWHHELFNWRDDWRWPENGIQKEVLRQKVAQITFCRVAGCGHAVQVIAADGWAKWDCPFFPSKTLRYPLCIVRVNLIRMQSQYVGWMSQAEFSDIDVVDYGYRKTAKRRVVLDWMLHRGLPDIVGGNGHVTDEQDVHFGPGGRP